MNDTTTVPMLNSAKFIWGNSFMGCMIPNNVLEFGGLDDTTKFKTEWKPVGYSTSAFKKDDCVAVMLESQESMEQYWTHIPVSAMHLMGIPIAGTPNPLLDETIPPPQETEA